MDTTVTTLNEKVAIVTGAGQGLGEAIATMLANSGAIVAVCDIKSDAAQRVSQEICAAGGEAQSFVIDVSDETAVQKTVADIVKCFGRIDILVNNAGVDITKPVEKLHIAEWDLVLDVNLRGPFLLAKSAYEIMRRQGSGHIVNITSTAAKRAWTEAAAYHASKWGLLGFSHALHAEARRHGIKVSAVVSGGMRTPFILNRFPDTDPATLQDPKNVAETVRFVLTTPPETVIPEVMVLPMKETSWP